MSEIKYFIEVRGIFRDSMNNIGVFEGKNLAPKDPTGYSDPFVVINVEKSSAKVRGFCK